MDPRVEADGVTPADLADQLAFNLGLRAALDEAQQAVARLDSARGLLKPRVDAQQRQALEIDAALAGIETALVTDDADSYPPPMLIDQLGYLYSMTARSDQKPGRDAYDRFAELRADLDGLLATLNQLTQRTSQLVAASPD